MEAELYSKKEIKAKVSGLQVRHNGAQGLLQADVGLGKSHTRRAFSPFSRYPNVKSIFLSLRQIKIPENQICTNARLLIGQFESF